MRGSRGHAAVTTAVLALLVFIVLPGTLYLGNLPAFQAAAWPLMRLLIVPVLLVVVLAMLGLRVAGTRDLGRYRSIVAALTLLVWAQSYLLVWDYGQLDGSSIDWSAGAWRGWLDLSLWLAVLAAAARWHRRLERPLVTGALAIVLLQAGSVVATGMSQRAALALKSSNRFASADLAPLASFSAERNVVQIVLDSFQADVFADIVRGPGGAAFQKALPGFTFYEEHLGTFPATYLALPVIISGRIYKNHMPQRQFMDEAYTEGSILRAARQAGFEVDVAADSWILDNLAPGGIDNGYLTARPPLVQETARLIDLALFRLAPHWLKRRVYNGQQWLIQPMLTRSVLADFPYFTHNAFLADMVRTLTVDRAKPVYKYIHLMTTHAPFVVDDACRPVGHVVPRNRANVTAQSRCSLAFVVALLDGLQRAGIYERSLIVIMADHGGWVPPHRFPVPVTLDPAGPAVLLPDFVALATPLLAVKPPGATGPMQISQARTRMSDVAATIDATMDLRAGVPGHSLLAADYPVGERRFYTYHWSRSDPVSRYIQAIGELIVTGSAYDPAAWHVGETFLPPEEP